MPVALYGVDLHERWMRATKAYAHTVSIYGSGTREAREAWRFAAEVLDELVRNTARSTTTINH